jgi:predicted amidohydrolase
MKIGLVQSSPHLGDVQKNLKSHFAYIEKAKKENVQLIIFPELSLTGYTLQDLVEEVALYPDSDPTFIKIKKASEEISIVFGFVEKKDNGLFYNSSAYLSDGEIKNIHRKVFPPTYGMFEEMKFFAQGKNFHTFSTPFGKTGMMICYDFLQLGACYLLFAGGSDTIIVLSAAPGRGYSKEDKFESSNMWESMGASLSRFSTSFVVYCNRVGFEDGKVFAGGSFIYGPTGNLKAKARYIEEEFLIHDINLDEIAEVRKKRLYKRNDRPEIILEALKRIINSYED